LYRRPVIDRPPVRYTRVMADIGEPVREIEVVPVEDPVPGELPIEAPAPAPDLEPAPA
jgi:hypothetical protein